MATALSLTPLFRQSVGFDRFNELFETLSAENSSKQAFPPYDIVKQGENNYQILMALAGYNETDLEITLENDTLKIVGKSEAETEATESLVYLHRGIAKRGFERTFRLADHMKIVNANLSKGLLSINVEREIPEEKKPQVIPINHLV